MGRMKVHELAKELNMPSKELVDKLIELKYDMPQMKCIPSTCKHLEFMSLVYILAKRKSKDETLIPALFRHSAKITSQKKY